MFYKFLCLVTGLVCILLIFKCSNQDETILLALQYPHGQLISYDWDQTEYIEEYKNDSLWQVSEKVSTGIITEEILKHYDNSVFLKHAHHHSSRILNPDKKTYSLKDTIIYIYSFQTSDGRIIKVENDKAMDSTEVESYLGKFKDLAPKYPDRPVPIGYTWTQAVKVQLENGEFNEVTTSYRLASLTTYKGNKCAIIETWAETSHPVNKEIIDNEMILTGQYVSKIQGTIYHAYELGIIAGFDQKIEVRANLLEKSAQGEAVITVKKMIKKSYELKERIVP